MVNKEKKELAVAALQNGTVIDHIPTASLFKVVNLLGLANLNDVSVTIGNNLDSPRLGKKGIMVEKFNVTLPDELIDIVKCNNPKCITNNEPMRTHFHVIDREHTTLRCHFCERPVAQQDITLK